MNDEKDQGKLEFWAILELFGHQKIAGFVRSVPLGGDVMLRVDVPQITYKERVYGDPGKQYTETTIQPFTKFYSPKSVYAMTPVSEEVAKAAMQNFHVEPISTFDLRALPAPATPSQPPSADAFVDDEDEDNDFGLVDENTETDRDIPL